MLKLKLGFMSIAELAEWSGRTPSYLSDNKAKWCKKHLS